MVSISLCMIVKNEQHNLAACLDSVQGLADEIVVVDTGSDDDTKRIALEYTQNVHDFEWIDDFSAARNFAFSKASCEYILWLDADDRLEGDAKQRLIDLKSEIDPSVDAVMLRYNVGFDEQDRVTFSYYRERLVRREAGFRWHDPVHEYIATHGNVISLDIAVCHRKQRSAEPPSARNLRIYRSIIEKGGALSPRGMYYFARELSDHGQLREALGWFERFLDSGLGWVEDNIGACLAVGAILQTLGDEKRALAGLLRSFGFDTPRAEVCCRIGYLFKARPDYRQAAFWFELAQSLERPAVWGFVRDDDWGYVPCLECAVCYYNLGDLARAVFYNRRAGMFKPDSEQVAHNQRLFDSLRPEAKGDGIAAEALTPDS